MKNIWIAGVLAGACVASLAKIPPPVLDDAAKLKAAETAAKTAWQGKLDAFQLCKAQDRVAAVYRKSAGATQVKATSTTAATAAAAAPTAAASNVAAMPAVAGGTAAAPAGAPTATGCADPGPFAFTPPEQKPLEASGAHSPAGNASSPPSSKTTAAEIAPAKPSVKK
jgi:hypothetical protein